MLISIAAVHGAEKEFSYNFQGAHPYGFGTDKSETYDVAIKIDNPDMSGLNIIGIKVPIIGNTEGISDFKGFLSNELRTKNDNKKKVNDPDICECVGDFSDGFLTVTFDKPYEIPETGIYIGYSLTVADGYESTKPIAVINGNYEGGMWFHSTSSQLKWNDYAKRRDIISDISVIIDGKFLDNAASVVILPGQYAKVGEPLDIKTAIKNNGITPIESISYTLHSGETEKKGMLEFNEPIPAGPGYPFFINVPFNDIDESGMVDFELTFDQINGKPNESKASMTGSEIEVLPFIPVNRPLVEEYTGLNCVWCPQGYVMLEGMHDRYQDNFVALSYHSESYEAGCMVCMETYEFPYRPSGYPQAQVNRTTVNSIADIPDAWHTATEAMSPADIKVSLAWADNEKNILEAVATTRFTRNITDSHYRVSFAIVADSLSDPSWLQSNAYASEDVDITGLEGPYWDLFIHTSPQVSGLVFNDVVISYPDVNGIDDSLPSDIVAEEPYEVRFTADTRDLLNIRGENIVKDFGHTRVVAIITDGTGKPVNCISSGYPEEDLNIVSINENTQVISTQYFDLTGKLVKADTSGVIIKIETFENGKIKASKTINT